MTNREWGISDRQFVEILWREFDVRVNPNCMEELERARRSLIIYENREEFLKQTRWRQDNPELTEERYLTENRICRWIDEKFMYFSRLLWEGDIKKLVR